MHLGPVISCALPGIMVAFTSMSLKAQTLPELVFTENRSSVLTVTLNGAAFGTIVNTGPDRWTWDSGVTCDGVNFSPLASGVAGNPRWLEPGETHPLFNVVSVTSVPHGSTKTFTAGQSPSFEQSFGFGLFGQAGGTVGGAFSMNIGNPFAFDTEVFSFHKAGALSNVPDISSTLVLLALSAATMFAFAGFARPEHLPRSTRVLVRNIGLVRRAAIQYRTSWPQTDNCVLTLPRVECGDATELMRE